MTVPKLTAALLLLVCFISCSKDTTTDPTPNPQPLLDSSHVSRIWFIDSTAAGQDTTGFEVFAFDNSKRVISVTDSFKSGGVYTLFAIKQFSYAGTDTLPVRSVLTVKDGVFRDTATTFYTYNVAGQRIKDSILRSTTNGGPLNKRRVLVTYTFVTGKIFGYSNDSLLAAGPATKTYDTATLDAAGNITMNIKNTAGINRMVSNITYDNRPHPLSELNVFKTFTVFPTSRAEFFLVTPNNMTHINRVTTGGATSSENIDVWNSYKANGMPYRIVYPNRYGNGVYEKYVFDYKHL